MVVFSPDQLVRKIELTNNRLAINKQPQLTTGELSKSSASSSSALRDNFGKWAGMWKTEAIIRLNKAPAFGEKTGMPRKRLDGIWSSLTFSRQGVCWGKEGSAAHRWRYLFESLSSLYTYLYLRLSLRPIVFVSTTVCRAGAVKVAIGLSVGCHSLSTLAPNPTMCTRFRLRPAPEAAS
jgi:hypothetical protein